MAKPEWGVRRTCKKCATVFYDLSKPTITCPKCSTLFKIDEINNKPDRIDQRRTIKAVDKEMEELLEVEEPTNIEDLDEDEEDLIES